MKVVKAIGKFVKSIPHRLRNMVVPKNVTWPTIPNTFRRTGAVVAVSAISAVIIGMMDTAFSFLLRIPFLLA